MHVFMTVLSALGAYLLGSLNFGIIVSRHRKGYDLRDHGSGNAGFTNAYRVMGPANGLLVMGGDVLKSLLAMLLGYFLAGDDGKLAALLFVILGHVFPLYFRFRGGKGFLTTVSVLLMFDWRIFLLILAVFFITFAISRFVSLSSILCAIALPISMAFFYPDRPVHIAVGILIGAGIIFLHRANIGRLFAGTESRFVFRPSGDANKK